MGTVQIIIQHRNKIIVTLILLVVMLLAAVSLAAAQTCSGDPCILYTPTPTQTAVPPTPTSTGTIIYEPTPTVDPNRPTPTPVPMPNPLPFPRPHFNVPTSIPPIKFTPWPSPVSVQAVTPIPLHSISATFNISYTAFMTNLNGSAITDSYGLSGTISGLSGVVDGLISHTNYFTGAYNTLNSTATFTITTAPEWYAPPLPRPIANVGWTFEQMQSSAESGQRYSLRTWAWFTGYIIAMPIQLVKMLYELFLYMGPLGLFLTWLLLMLPLVLFVKFINFIKGIFVYIINTIIWFIQMNLELLSTLFRLAKALLFG